MRMENLKERLGRIPASEKDASANVGTEYEEVRIELIREQLREVKLRNEALEEENRGDSQTVANGRTLRKGYILSRPSTCFLFS